MAIYYSIYAISLIAFFIHYAYIPEKKRTKPKIVETFLLYQIVFSLGATSLLAFLGLTFMKEYISAYSGWNNCQWVQLLANVNLSFAVLGFLSIFYRKDFWMATILGFSIWIFADGITHIYDAFANNNFAEGNIGGVLITDITIPVILVILLAIYRKTV